MKERERGNGREGEQKKNDDAGDLSAKMKHVAFKEKYSVRKLIYELLQTLHLFVMKRSVTRVIRMTW